MHACKCHAVGQARKEALEVPNAAYIAQEKMGIISVSIPLSLNTASKYDTRSREHAHANVSVTHVSHIRHS